MEASNFYLYKTLRPPQINMKEVLSQKQNYFIQWKKEVVLTLTRKKKYPTQLVSDMYLQYWTDRVHLFMSIIWKKHILLNVSVLKLAI